MNQPSVSSLTNTSGTIPLSALPSNISSCPSFNSLNHSYFNSVVPPKVTSDEDSQRYVSGADEYNRTGSQVVVCSQCCIETRCWVLVLEP